MGSKSKINLMKSYKINKKEAAQKRKKRKENALDIISKSFFKNIKANYLKGSDGVLLIKSDVIRL